MVCAVGLHRTPWFRDSKRKQLASVGDIDVLETSHWSLGFYKLQRYFIGDLRSCRTQSCLDGGWGSAGYREVSFENGGMQAFSCSFFCLGNQSRAGCSIIWDAPCDFIGMNSVYQ